jgi:hypothetical protein
MIRTLQGPLHNSKSTKMRLCKIPVNYDMNFKTGYDDGGNSAWPPFTDCDDDVLPWWLLHSGALLRLG